MRQRFVLKEPVRLANAELSRVENNHDFGVERLDCGLASLARNEFSNLSEPFGEFALKALQPSQSVLDRQVRPSGLSQPGAADRLANFGRRGGGQVAPPPA